MKKLSLCLLLALTAFTPFLSSCTSVSQGQQQEISAITIKDNKVRYRLFRFATADQLCYQMSYSNGGPSHAIATLSFEQMMPILELVRKVEHSRVQPIKLDHKRKARPVPPYERSVNLLYKAKEYSYYGDAPRMQETYTELLQWMKYYKKTCNDTPY